MARTFLMSTEAIEVLDFGVIIVEIMFFYVFMLSVYSFILNSRSTTYFFRGPKVYLEYIPDF